jgi:hypothetical protein
MDLTEALPKWETLGGTTNSYTDDDGNYNIDFINRDGDKEGWVKVYPGQGIQWHYPESLFYTQEDLWDELELNKLENQSYE